MQLAWRERSVTGWTSAMMIYRQKWQSARDSEQQVLIMLLQKDGVALRASP